MATIFEKIMLLTAKWSLITKKKAFLKSMRKHGRCYTTLKLTFE